MGTGVSQPARLPTCLFLCGRHCGEGWGQKGRKQVGGVGVSLEKEPGPVLAWLQLGPEILREEACPVPSRIHGKLRGTGGQGFVPYSFERTEHSGGEGCLLFLLPRPKDFSGSRMLCPVPRCWLRWRLGEGGVQPRWCWV